MLVIEIILQLKSSNFAEIDLDECVSNPCLNGGSCVDQPAAYECLCRRGFDGDTCGQGAEILLKAKYDQ